MAQHLIHIGYPKAGSTFLQAWFELRPGIHYSPGGLGGFYNAYEIARPSGSNYEYYVTSFEGLATPHESAGDVRLEFGGAEPERLDPVKENQASVCALLKSLFPGSRILIVTRGFRGMIMSAYSQSVKMGGRLHLEGMCRKLAERLQEDAYHYYDYDYLIQLYGEAFGEGNLIIMPYELLREDPQKFLAFLENQLGLEHVDIPLGRINPSLSAGELYWYPVISRAVSSAASLLGSAGHKKIYRWYAGKTLDNKLRHFIRLLTLIWPGRKETAANFPSEILRYCEGKANRLKANPIYSAYAEDYLWTDDSAASKPWRAGDV